MESYTFALENSEVPSRSPFFVPNTTIKFLIFLIYDTMNIFSLLKNQTKQTKKSPINPIHLDIIVNILSIYPSKWYYFWKMALFHI